MYSILCDPLQPSSVPLASIHHTLFWAFLLRFTTVCFQSSLSPWLPFFHVLSYIYLSAPCSSTCIHEQPSCLSIYIYIYISSHCVLCTLYCTYRFYVLVTFRNIMCHIIHVWMSIHPYISFICTSIRPSLRVERTHPVEFLTICKKEIEGTSTK